MAVLLHRGSEKVQGEFVGLVDLLLRAATGAFEPPAGKLVALLEESEIRRPTLASRQTAVIVATRRECSARYHVEKSSVTTMST